jgi:ABC-type spermidine/putrescine transport system permease subunit I
MMNQPFKRRVTEALLSAPSLLWLLVFFAVPIGLVSVLAFRPADLHGGVGSGWTLDAVKAAADPAYLPIWWRTLWISAVSTLLCLLVALPMSYHLARMSRRWQGIMVLLVVLPFLTNFLIRVFAWRTLLHPDGMLCRALISMGVMTEEQQLLYNAGAVVVVMFYVQLAVRDPATLRGGGEVRLLALLDAARDLGAGELHGTPSGKIFVPGVRGGLSRGSIDGALSVRMGQYVIPQVVGGVE